MEFSISQMKAMQRELYALHKNTWSAREPDFGNKHIRYMVEEIGEVVAILKKKGSAAVAENPAVRDYAKEYKELITHGQE